MELIKQKWFSAFAPLVLLIAALLVLFQFGAIGVLKTPFPPIENAFIEKVTLKGNEIIVSVFNDGPDEVTISQVFVNDAYNVFEMTPSNTLKPRESGLIKINYPWVPSEPLKITLLSASGLTFEKELEAAFSTPERDLGILLGLTAIGFYVG